MCTSKKIRWRVGWGWKSPKGPTEKKNARKVTLVFLEMLIMQRWCLKAAPRRALLRPNARKSTNSIIGHIVWEVLKKKKWREFFFFACPFVCCVCCVGRVLPISRHFSCQKWGFDVKCRSLFFGYVADCGYSFRNKQDPEQNHCV